MGTPQGVARRGQELFSPLAAGRKDELLPRPASTGDTNTDYRKTETDKANNTRLVVSLFWFLQAYVFEEETGGCVSFLVNNDSQDNATVEFRNVSVELLPKSISILEGCSNVIFNTVTVSN